MHDTLSVLRPSIRWAVNHEEEAVRPYGLRFFRQRLRSRNYLYHEPCGTITGKKNRSGQTVITTMLGICLINLHSG